ncbi:MAG: hypothetical protein HY427_03695 [Candidatus Levybacteria bacterium]|nr:hypothetical protein [Candidatus Levybacteria bacterium]
MEFYYIATGPKHWLDLHISHMQSVDFYLDGIAPNGQKVQQHVKGGLEPVQLYRFIFPKPAMPFVLSTFDEHINKPVVNGLGLQAWALKKALGLKDIPKDRSLYSDAKMKISKDYLQILPIGIKEDDEGIMGSTGMKQEKI